MAVQAECAAFLRGVAAGFASAVAVPHRGVRTAARGRAEVRFFDGETAARRELADAERFIMGDAVCALDMVSALGGITDRTEFFDCEAASRRDIEDAAFAPSPHVPAAAEESSPLITVDPVMLPAGGWNDLPEGEGATLCCRATLLSATPRTQCRPLLSRRVLAL